LRSGRTAAKQEVALEIGSGEAVPGLSRNGEPAAAVTNTRRSVRSKRGDVARNGVDGKTAPGLTLGEAVPTAKLIRRGPAGDSTRGSGVAAVRSAGDRI